MKQKNKKIGGLLFETSGDLQPIMCFNIITRGKGYSLFPILSGLIKPSLCNFRIPLANGLLSPVGMGGLIPFLRTVLESFLPHTAHQFFGCPVPISNEWDLSWIYLIFRVNQRGTWVLNWNLDSIWITKIQFGLLN